MDDANGAMAAKRPEAGRGRRQWPATSSTGGPVTGHTEGKLVDAEDNRVLENWNLLGIFES
jgi:hypothetical protein